MSAPACAPWPEFKRPLVAILRGVRPDEVLPIGNALVEAGFEAIEVPLNSPQPFDSIALLAKHLPSGVLVGAGTVLDAADVTAVHDAGGRLIVSPNFDPAVLRRAGELAMVTLPGVFSPTEALGALRAGASALKFFPANALGASGIGAIAAILPRGAVFGAVGGVSDQDFPAYLRAGARLFGLGSSLYKPGSTAAEVAEHAGRAIAAYDAAAAGPAQ
jgi:2-dehydro-3-deoxyphosphogalactonate aldolase